MLGCFSRLHSGLPRALFIGELLLSPLSPSWVGPGSLDIWGVCLSHSVQPLGSQRMLRKRAKAVSVAGSLLGSAWFGGKFPESLALFIGLPGPQCHRTRARWLSRSLLAVWLAFLLSLTICLFISLQPDLLNFKKGWMSILDEPGEVGGWAGGERLAWADAGLLWKGPWSRHGGV